VLAAKARSGIISNIRNIPSKIGNLDEARNLAKELRIGDEGSEMWINVYEVGCGHIFKKIISLS
jgi:hypothetical protein